MGLVSHTYWPQSIEAPPKPEHPKKIPVESDEDLVERLGQLTKDMPVLVYTSKATAAVIVDTIAGAVLVTQDTDPSSLRKCDTRSAST